MLGARMLAAAAAAAPAASSVLFSSSGASLAGWTNAGATVNSSSGNPAPSLEATGGHYAFTDAGIVAGCVIELDMYVIAGGTALADFFFGCDASGAGQYLRLEGRSGDASGFGTSTNWTTWGNPAGAGSVSAGAWHHVKIEIYANNIMSWYLDGARQQRGVSFTPSGPYLGIVGDASSVTGGRYDNITVTLITKAPTTYQSTVFADSPLAYWPLDETSGTTMGDATNNGHDGIYGGDVSLAVPALVSGYAVDFGSSGYGDVSDGTFLNIPVFTLEAWIEPPSPSSIHQIMARDDVNNLRQFQWRINASGYMELLILQGTSNTTVQTVTSSVNVADGSVHHIVAVVQGSLSGAGTATLYVDGASAGSSAIQPISTGTGSGLQIASRYSLSSPAGYYEPGIGFVDEPAIYASALSAARIQAHYQAGLG